MTKRSDIVGLTRLKNKVKKNAFDLSHRHMFTCEPGELLPVFSQWVNPNETFKIGYNGMTRTTPLQTAAFTRLRENIQYYFVPFQSLWKYFEGNINNMTVGQSGENISKIASSPVSDSVLGTGMPYVNYSYISSILSRLLQVTAGTLIKYDIPVDYDSAMSFLRGEFAYPSAYSSDVLNMNSEYRFLSSRNTLRYCSIAKLLNAFGYGNFTSVMSYDLITSLVAYCRSKGYTLFSNMKASELGDPSVYKEGTFFHSSYGISFADNASLVNMPNLSILPLLAYHKIINDHYRYLQWQPYRSYLSNIDYMSPSDNMNYGALLSPEHIVDLDSIFDMKFSNLPLDYFNGVLPKAQYGDESSALVHTAINTTNAQVISDLKTHDVSALNANEKFTISAFYPGIDDPAPSSKHVQTTSVDNTLTIDSTGGLETDPAYFSVSGGSLSNSTHIDSKVFKDISMPTSAVSSLRISALRSALAIQKYKEIQNSNDPDFASQVLAHFGIKPKHDDYMSEFIGGGDSTIDINPVVNQNLADEDSQTDIKAIATGTLSAGCKFHSDTYGIIIGIYRCTPQLDLAHVGIDRNLFKTDASDFPLPELDSIGMQTQYRSELAVPALAESGGTLPLNNEFDFALTYGYLPRYAELKTSYDRVDGAFNSAYSSWVTGYTPDLLKTWVLRRLTFDSSALYPQISDFLVCNPDICYNIFLNQRSSSVNDDKLLVGSVNTCVAVRPFSKYGLPYEN